MFLHTVLSLLALAAFVFLGFSVFTALHYLVFYRTSKAEDRRRRMRLPGCFFAGGLLLLQIMSDLYSPSNLIVLREIQQEQSDEDDHGDPESPQLQLNRQLKRIRRGTMVGDLVLRL